MIAAILKFFGLQTLPSPKLFPRTVIVKHYENANCIALSSRSSMWGDGHSDLLVEHDETLPFIGRPNPRRREWMHDSWITEVQ